MELLEYLQVLKRRKAIIIVVFLAAVLSAGIASYLVTPVYQSTTSLLVKSQSKASQLPFELGMMGELGKNEILNYIEIIKSRDLAERVALALGINPQTQKEEFKALRAGITVQPVQGTDAVRISFQSTDPGFAAKAANTYAKEFTDRCRESNQEEAGEAEKFISKQLEYQKEELRKTQDKLKKFKATNKLLSIEEQGKAQIASMIANQTEEKQTLMEIESSKRLLNTLTGQLRAKDKTIISSVTFQDNPALSHYRSELLALETQLSEAREKYTDAHPTVIRLNERIAEVKAQLKQDYNEVATSKVETVNPVYQQLIQRISEVNGELAALQARHTVISRNVAENDRIISGYPQKEMEYAILERDVGVASEIYSILLKKQKETEIAKAQQTAQVDLIDRAVQPESPIKPKKKLNVAIAGFLGLFVGCGLAFMLEYMDTSIKTPEDIEQLLGVPVMGTIPLIKESSGSSRKKRQKRARVEGETARGGTSLDQ